MSEQAVIPQTEPNNLDSSTLREFSVLIARCPSGFLSSGRAPLLAPSPLRTGLEGFPFIRLEHPKTPP